MDAQPRRAPGTSEGRRAQVTTSVLEVLPAEQWRAATASHEARVDELTGHHRYRASTHRSHPVEDFLFTYYSLRPAQLRRWYPGMGVALADAGERADWRFHRTITVDGVQAVTVDLPRFTEERGRQLDFTRRLLTATAAAPAQFGCFGLHEWAMVYRQDPEQVRHSAWPLRLGHQGTDEVVRGHQIRCSHYDAYRFFTPPARPLNLLAPDLDSRVRMEQPGCLHATMDLYKWAYKLLPAVSSELLLECFLLARWVREWDMRASPYDLSELGYTPVTIETPEGKAEYVAAQREFARLGQSLRQKLLDELNRIDPRS